MPARARLALLVALPVACGPLTLARATPALAAAPANADAKAHFDAAAELYAREDYAGAAREFAIAHALDPQVDTLFAWAQAERLAERYEEATTLYERLLAGELSASQREAVESLLAEVRELAATATPPDETSDASDASDVSDVSDTRDTRERDRDRLAPILVGVGAGLTLVGGGLVIGGLAADAKVRGATSYTAFEQAFDPATQRGRGAVALYASGGVLAGIGVIALIVGAVRHSRRDAGDDPPRLSLAPWLGPTSTGLGLRVGGL